MSEQSRGFRTIHVKARPGNRQQGFLIAGNRVMRCALGRSGMGIGKREGDGKTPIGRFRLLEAFARPDKWQMQHESLSISQIDSTMGWCDAVGDRNYNCAVSLPYPNSHEVLKRDDHLYDVFLVMDHNVSCRMTRGGSAIFFHLAHDDYRPTEGCVAISRADMEWLWPRIGVQTEMVMG